MSDDDGIVSLLIGPVRGSGDDDEASEDYDDGPRDTIRRKVVTPKRDARGRCVQPDYASMTPEERAEREVYENHQRLRAANQLNYADMYTGNTRTYDPDGRYNCGRCNQEETKKCLVVVEQDGKTAIKLDMEAASCRLWENQCAGDPEAKMGWTSVERSGYAIAKNGVGWGCHRCGEQEPATMPDSVGRPMFCTVLDARVFPMACCDDNDVPTVTIDANGNPTKP